jgi:hypothetical protein
MSLKIGTNATVKIGTTTVANMASWSINDTRPVIEANPFGTTNREIAGTGNRTVNGSISGYLDIDDATGQDVINTAYDGRTTVSGFRLYVDSTNYYACDTATDSDAGVYITSRNISAAQNEVIPVEFAFEVSGAWKEFSS